MEMEQALNGARPDKVMEPVDEHSPLTNFVS